MRRRTASRDEGSVNLRLFDFSLPTKESVEKVVLIQIECNLNIPSAKLNNRTLYDDIFHPKIRESMDSELKKLFSQYEDEKEAIRIWKDTSSELWSNLPPKLVWAGGGKIEGELLLDFLQYLTRKVRRKEFDTLGDSMITALRNLREWQFISNEICSGMAPVDAIVEERKAIYERKSAFLQEMQIETDFV